jgi:hypothetical protein
MKVKMRLFLPFGLVVGTWMIGAVAGDTQTSSTLDDTRATEPTYEQDALNAQQDPLLMGAIPAVDVQMKALPRHRQEKAHLMKRIDSKSGRWTSSHPRHRLLEALFGYTRYRERNMAELDRWRSLYKSVGKKQKKASKPDRASKSSADHRLDAGARRRLSKKA